MLPAHLAESIRKQILFCLQSTFDFRDHDVEKAFERFLNDPESGLFKGPWVQLKRPFRPADTNAKIPFDIDSGRRPFLHQWRSWKRLSSKNQSPQPTIVTTGTGSGKTECILFPILDHCLRARQQGQKGIKAIILYPMNALASDQEERFAKTVIENTKLKAAGIRIGNYTGRYDPSDPGASADSGTKSMGYILAEDCQSRIYHGISNHGVQQEDPPDVLLTNYKMLDFLLLLRPQDQNLWRFNSPGVLRYLVMDALHTYDGAQGSDVACLIRRLKERLDIPKGELCFVGTSATLDDRDVKLELLPAAAASVDATETSSDRLARFASTLFEEEITAESVIGEDRLTVEEIIRPHVRDVVLPDPAECLPADEEDAVAYATRQSVLWGGPTCPSLAEGATEQDMDEAHDKWAIALGEWLKATTLFKYLLEIFDKAETHREPPLTWVNLIKRLKQDELGFLNIKGQLSVIGGHSRRGRRVTLSIPRSGNSQ